MKIPELPSCWEMLHGLVYFPRMAAKIRLHAAGRLPEDYIPNLGSGFDERCSSFLGIDYAAFATEVKNGADDEAAWAWAMAHGTEPTEEQIEVWNGFMTKRGWKDEGAAQLEKRKRDAGLEGRADIHSFFDFINVDEERPPQLV